MSLKNIIKTGISTLVNSTVINVLAQRGTDQVISIVQEHFTLSTYEIANAYQTSYSYAIAAISVGLAAPEQKYFFLQEIAHSHLEQEFFDQIEPIYFQPFVIERGVQNDALGPLRKQFIEQIQALAKQPPSFQAEDVPLTESELAELLNYQETSAMTDLVLEQLKTLPSLPLTPYESALPLSHVSTSSTTGEEPDGAANLEAFFRYKDLLGNAILFFFREILRKDERVEKTLAALQREGLWADVRDLKKAQADLTTSLQQQLDDQKTAVMQAIQAGNFLTANDITQALQTLQQRLDNIPQLLEQAQAAWQTSQQQFLEFAERFDTWAALLDVKVEQVLEQMGQLSGQLDKVHDEVVATKDLTAEVLNLLTQLMERFDLAPQVKPRDEFTQHNNTSLNLIQEALTKLHGVQKDTPEYNQLAILAGSVLSSTGDIEAAENLFIQAKALAKNDANKALACFNLFQIRVRRGAYAEALTELQTAIAIDPNYALHEVEKYPIERLLGVGGMGCVFLCHDEWRENQVVVKCFWEGKKGRREDVFREVLIMRNLKSPYVPKTLSYGYVDSRHQERPYFVTEYIEGALDGETWLKQQGKLAVDIGLDVGLQMAQGLDIAHKAGIYHLDLKPANLLLKPLEDKMLLKIIDFGLARVATSLKQQAMLTQTRSGKSQLSQAIFGTLDYASPEQMGQHQYGKPGPKSDVFAFGATLYRLLTHDSPRFPHPRKLPDLPELQWLLLDCLEQQPDKRPDTQTLIEQLSSLLEKQQEIPANLSLPKEEVPRTLSLSKREQGKKEVVPRSLSLSKRATEEISALKPGDVFQDRLKDGTKSPEMVIIPAGKFKMGDIQGNGDNDELPVHGVSVKSFAIGRYPVTVAEFRQFVEATGYKTEAEQGDGAYVLKDGKWQKIKEANWRKPYFPQNDDQPVVCVSWNDAMAYLKWLNEQTGQHYCLPSEAEWEYAARANTETDYWWGNHIGNNRANCNDSGSQWSGKQTAPIGSFEPNPFGLYDTVGNVWEWCNDFWHENYKNAPTDGSAWKKDGHNNRHVVCGGAWGGTPWEMRVSNRYGGGHSTRNNYGGFRIARLLKDEQNQNETQETENTVSIDLTDIGKDGYVTFSLERFESFQDFLDTLYTKFLADKVPTFSYETSWILVNVENALPISKLAVDKTTFNGVMSGDYRKLKEVGIYPGVQLKLRLIEESKRQLLSTEKTKNDSLEVQQIFNKIKVVQGDITLEWVDAIVNPTDQVLSGGGGADFAIHQAAGPELRNACKQLKTCAVGEAKITEGYNLPAKFVIHTVGPMWKGGNNDEKELLARCYRNCLALAEQNAIKTMAFPAISTGAFHFPIELAAKIAVHEINHFLRQSVLIKQVLLVCTAKTYDNFYAALESHSEKPTGSMLIDDFSLSAEGRNLDIFRNRLKDGSEGPEMVIIPAGQFKMGDIQGKGSDWEKPVHEVSVESFAIGRYQVTVAEFCQFVEATCYKTESEQGHGAYIWKENDWIKTKDANWHKPYFPQNDDQPVVCVSWNDAMVYIKWLNEQTGQHYRLPSEAEWEYAARAGTKTDYWWGNDLGKNHCNCYNSDSQWSGKQTAPVNSFESNEFNLYNTIGNVWEWCADFWHENYKDAPADGSVWKQDGNSSLRVIRGSAWYSKLGNVRVSIRYRREHMNRFNCCGFRLAREINPPQKFEQIYSIKQQAIVETRSENIICDRLQDDSEGPEMVIIPAGQFKMGDIQGNGVDDELPLHEVSVESFAIGVYPITFADYDLFTMAIGKTKIGDMDWGRGNRPVIQVSYYNAIAYVEWLSQQTGQHYRLPTEAEWEYAARAGTETDYWWGNEIDNKRAHYNGCGNEWDGEMTAPVDFFEPNPFGLHDVIGNVWEWTGSEYELKYSGKEQQLLEKPTDTHRIVRRSGAWYYDPIDNRVSYRTGIKPSYWSLGGSFRIVREINPQPKNSTDEITSQQCEATDHEISIEYNNRLAKRVSEERRLPILGEGMAIDAQEQTVNTKSIFLGGISVNGGPVEKTVTLNLSDSIDFQGCIIVDSEHIGQQAEVVVYVAYWPIDAVEGEPTYLLLDENNKGVFWANKDMNQYIPRVKEIRLESVMDKLPPYMGSLGDAGIWKIYFGYRLLEGSLKDIFVQNANPIEVTILEDTQIEPSEKAADSMLVDEFSLPTGRNLKPGEVFRDRLQDDSEGPEMVIIPAGQFKMGDIQGTGKGNEQPIYGRTVESFTMGRFPVTFAEYDQFVEATHREKPKDVGWGRDNRPVIYVTWEDAVTYAQWLSQQTGFQYRLPTEVEWEYAARAGTETNYWWGNDIGQNHANCRHSGSPWQGRKTAPVDYFPANLFGLYDMLGNVWEWTCSVQTFHGYSLIENSYKGSFPNGTWNQLPKHAFPTLRGGAWNMLPEYCRSAARYHLEAYPASSNVGFRLVREIKSNKIQQTQEQTPIAQSQTAIIKKQRPENVFCDRLQDSKEPKEDFSLPLTPSRWEGEPSRAISPSTGENKDAGKQGLPLIQGEEELHGVVPPPSGRGLGGGRNLDIFRDRLTDGSEGPEMVIIPAGQFKMGDIQGNGDDDELPLHEVSVKQFAIGCYTITRKEYSLMKENNKKNPSESESRFPVTNISWYDALVYAEWLSQQTKQKYRLPTEAEWEYAARAGAETDYPWGNQFHANQANCRPSGSRGSSWREGQIASVDSFSANQFGLYDTIGNVWEWTCSEYEKSYQGKEQKCVNRNDIHDVIVVRGGSLAVGPVRSRLSFRGYKVPIENFGDVGFRLVREIFPVFRDNLPDGTEGPKMVVIPAGKFKMGDIQGSGLDNEQPVHEVHIKHFAIGCYTITFTEYEQFAQATGRTIPKDESWGRSNQPVIHVSWQEAIAYTEWLSQQTGQQYRLPTEAEWEYAARAGTETDYWWGNEIGTNQANCRESGSQWDGQQTAPVGSFLPNPFGLYDTVGNVWEWTSSEYDKYYHGKEQQYVPKNNKNRRVIRGGSWFLKAKNVRCSSRFFGKPTTQDKQVGFRIIREISETEIQRLQTNRQKSDEITAKKMNATANILELSPPDVNVIKKVSRGIAKKISEMAMQKIQASREPFGKIDIIQGDITQQKVEAIVNTTDRAFSGAGAVDKAIQSAGGIELEEACRQLGTGALGIGGTKITEGYNLPAQFVIHTVGPSWEGGHQGETEKLALCYRNCLASAEQQGFKIIAFPTIGVGGLGFSHELAAKVAIYESSSFLQQKNSSLEKVILVCFNQRTYEHFQETKLLLERSIFKNEV